MQTVSFQEAVAAIVKANPRYHAEAYEFVRDALEFTIKKKRKNRSAETNDIPTAELLDGVRLFALKEFGPMAITVLDFWGVRSCEDIGHIVFGLVDAGVFSITDNDTLDEFRKGYAFEDALLAPFRSEKKSSNAATPSSVESPV